MFRPKRQLQTQLALGWPLDVNALPEGPDQSELCQIWQSIGCCRPRQLLSCSDTACPAFHWQLRHRSTFPCLLMRFEQSVSTDFLTNSVRLLCSRNHGRLQASSGFRRPRRWWRRCEARRQPCSGGWQTAMPPWLSRHRSEVLCTSQVCISAHCSMLRRPCQPLQRRPAVRDAMQQSRHRCLVLIHIRCLHLELFEHIEVAIDVWRCSGARQPRLLPRARQAQALCKSHQLLQSSCALNWARCWQKTVSSEGGRHTIFVGESGHAARNRTSCFVLTLLLW